MDVLLPALPGSLEPGPCPTARRGQSCWEEPHSPSAGVPREQAVGPGEGSDSCWDLGHGPITTWAEQLSSGHRCHGPAASSRPTSQGGEVAKADKKTQLLLLGPSPPDPQKPSAPATLCLGTPQALSHCGWPGRGKHRSSPSCRGWPERGLRAGGGRGGLRQALQDSLGKSLYSFPFSPARPHPTPEPSETGVFKDLLESLKLTVSAALLPAPRVSSPPPTPPSAPTTESVCSKRELAVSLVSDEKWGTNVGEEV